MSVSHTAQASAQNRYLTFFVLGGATICSLGVANRNAALFYIGPLVWGFILSWPASRPKAALPRWAFPLVLVGAVLPAMAYAYAQENHPYSPHSVIWTGALATLPFIWLLNRGKKSADDVSAAVSKPVPQTLTPGGPTIKVVSPEEFVRLQNLRTELYDGPRSQRFAVLAAGLRAVELQQSQEKTEAAQRAAYKAWKFPEGATPQEQSELVSDHWLNWAKDHFHSGGSQSFAITAAVLRSLELGQSQDQAMEAGSKAAKAWALPAKVAAPAQSSPRAELLSAPAGKTRGIVAGLLKRSVPFPIPYSLGRTPSYVDKVIWSFSMQRAGTGANGRPLSPVPCQLEG